jgi:transposase-like protein
MLGKVKRLYSRDKKSLHEIAKTTGLSRNTIRKWVRGTDEVDKGLELSFFGRLYLTELGHRL